MASCSGVRKCTYVALSALSLRCLSTKTDAFKDVGDGDDAGDKVHIRVQQRSGRKSITTIQGLSADLDLKKILKAFKKTLSCNGSIIEHDQYGRVIQVQGDQRKSIKEFLIEEEVVKKDCVVVHGF